MVKNKLKDNKGMSLTMIIMTVVIILIIVTTLSYSSINSIKIKRLNELYTDIRLLNDEVAIYYLKNGVLPIDESKIYVINQSEEVDDELNFVLKNGNTKLEDLNSLINPNDYDSISDSAIYYELDLELFDNLTLNNTGNYIINEQSHTIFYVDGVKIDGVIYHNLPLEYINISYNEMKPITNVAKKSDIYLAMGEREVNIKDYLVIDSEEGKAQVKSITYEVIVENDNFELLKNGKLRSLKNFEDVGDNNSKIRVTVKDYFNNEYVVEIYVYLTDIVIKDSNGNIIDIVNMIKGEDRTIYFECLGYAANDNNGLKINKDVNSIVDTSIKFNENSENELIISGINSGTLNLSLIENNGNALKKIEVNVFDFDLLNVTNSNSVFKVDEINFTNLENKMKIELENNNENMSMDRVSVDWNSTDASVFTIEQDGSDIYIVPIGLGEAILECQINLGTECLEIKSIPVKVYVIE